MSSSSKNYGVNTIHSMLTLAYFPNDYSTTFFKNFFCLAVEPLIPSTWLTSYYLAFWKIYIVISHWWPIIIPKTANGVEWSWMMLLDVFFLKSMKKFWRYCKYHMKSSQRHNKDIIPFQWGVILPNTSNGS